MKTNFAIVLLVGFFWLIPSVAVFAAPQIVHARRGEGPVQIAERYGVDPKVFIELNRDRFVNPKRVSLIYTWQEFILPEAKEAQRSQSGEVLQKIGQRNSKIAIDTVSKETSVIKKTLPINTTIMTGNSFEALKTETSKYRESVYGGLKIFVWIVIAYFLVVLGLKPLCKNIFSGIKLPFSVTNNPIGGKQGRFRFFRENEESGKFICRCREDDVYTCIDWNENFLKFPRGLTALAKFLAEQNISHPIYAVPMHLVDRYAPFNEIEQRTLERYREEFINPAK